MRKFLMIPVLLVSSCAIGNLDSAVCDGLKRPIDNLASALLVDGGDRSVVAGANVVSAYDAGCKKIPDA